MITGKPGWRGAERRRARNGRGDSGRAAACAAPSDAGFAGMRARPPADACLGIVGRACHPTRKHGAAVRAVFFSNTRAARHRNSRRAGRDRVPEDAVTGQLAKMERPSKEEGFDDVLVAS